MAKRRAGKIFHSLNTLCLFSSVDGSQDSRGLFLLLCSAYFIICFNYGQDHAGTCLTAIFFFFFPESMRTSVSRHSRSHGHLVIQLFPYLYPAVTLQHGHRQRKKWLPTFISIQLVFVFCANKEVLLRARNSLQ